MCFTDLFLNVYLGKLSRVFFFEENRNLVPHGTEVEL